VSMVGRMTGSIVGGMSGPLTLRKGGAAAIPATAIRQRNTDVIRDRAGNTIQVRS
jgi:hypothetical protein